jgi:multidrug efflux pump subunit AcrB
MIGWIALAGIIVRNSILLVDFSVHEVQQGHRRRGGRVSLRVRPARGRS